MDSKERGAMVGVTVKNRMRMFEMDSGGNSSTASSTPQKSTINKPPVASKSPGLSPVHHVCPKPAVKKCGGGGGLNKPNQDHNQNDVSSNPSSPPGTGISAKQMFERKLSSAKEDDSSSSVLASKPNGLIATANNENKRIPPKPANGLKPAIRPKFGGKPNVVDKHTTEVDSPAVKAKEDAPKMETKSGKALANFLQKQEDNLKDSETSTNTLVSSPLSSTSSSSLVSTNTSGPHDFRSSLRSRSKSSTAQSPPPPPAKPSSPSSPSAYPLSTSTQDTTVKSTSIVAQWKDKERKCSLTDEKPQVKPIPKLPKSQTSSFSKSPSIEEEDTHVSLRQGKPSKTSNRASSGVLLRTQDGKKFRKVKLEDIPAEASPPEKPTVPTDVDLSPITDQYHKAVIELKEEADTSNTDYEEEAEYTDCASIDMTVLPRQPTFKRVSERISMIPDMTEEEEEGISGGRENVHPEVLEEGVEELIYDEGETPTIPSKHSDFVEEELYVDGTSEQPKEEEPGEDDTYEDEESIVQQMAKLGKTQNETEQEMKKRLKKEEEARKKEAKEKEKQRLNREKEEKNQRKKFQLTGEEIDVGEGSIKKDAKGRGKNLTVQEGQQVTIVRLENNPSNKWLVRCGNQMGYVESSNVNIDPAIIRQAMEKNRKASLASQQEEDDQPNYDDVPDLNEEEDENPDAIYEEF